MGLFNENDIKNTYFMFRKTLMLLFGDYDGIFFMNPECYSNEYC